MHDDEDVEPIAYVRQDRHDWLRRTAWKHGYITGFCSGIILFYGFESYMMLTR